MEMAIGSGDMVLRETELHALVEDQGHAVANGGGSNHAMSW